MVELVVAAWGRAGHNESPEDPDSKAPIYSQGQETASKSTPKGIVITQSHDRLVEWRWLRGVFTLTNSVNYIWNYSSYRLHLKISWTILGVDFKSPHNLFYFGLLSNKGNSQLSQIDTPYSIEAWSMPRRLLRVSMLEYNHGKEPQKHSIINHASRNRARTRLIRINESS